MFDTLFGLSAANYDLVAMIGAVIMIILGIGLFASGTFFFVEYERGVGAVYSISQLTAKRQVIFGLLLLVGTLAAAYFEASSELHLMGKSFVVIFLLTFFTFAVFVFDKLILPPLIAVVSFFFRVFTYRESNERQLDE